MGIEFPTRRVILMGDEYTARVIPFDCKFERRKLDGVIHPDSQSGWAVGP